MFQDRKDAGNRLALSLSHYKGIGAVVLAIPRGGVEVGYQVAQYLNAAFEIVIARRLPYPKSPNAGFGAVAEDGSTFIHHYAAKIVGPTTIETTKQQQKAEIKKRIETLRKDRTLPDLTSKTVILVDDGIAMGATMYAAIQLCQRAGANRIAVASPVCGPIVAEDMAATVDDMLVLETPLFFHTIAQVYSNFHNVSDTEVLEIMEKQHSMTKIHT